MGFINCFPEAGGPALWASYFPEGYLPVDLLQRAFITSEWTHCVVRSDGDLVRVHRPIQRGRVVPIGTAGLRHDALSDTFRVDLLSYGTLSHVELSLDLWSLCTLAESALGTAFREVLPHVGEWRGFFDVAIGGLVPHSPPSVCVSNVQKERFNFGSSTVRIGHRARSKLGVLLNAIIARPISSAAKFCRPIE